MSSTHSGNHKHSFLVWVYRKITWNSTQKRNLTLHTVFNKYTFYIFKNSSNMFLKIYVSF